MVDRFLRYSLERGRTITLIVQDEKGIRRLNLRVTALEEDQIAYVTARTARERKLPRGSILSASYARGDDGDTMKNERYDQSGS